MFTRAYSSPGGGKVRVARVILTCLKRPLNKNTLVDLIPKIGREGLRVHDPIDVVSGYDSDICLCVEGNHRAYSAMRSRWEGGCVYARVIRIPRGIDLIGETLNRITHQISQQQPFEVDMSLYDLLKNL